MELKYELIDNENENIDANFYKLYDENVIERPYWNHRVYDKMKMKEDVCDINVDNTDNFKTNVCNSDNLIIGQFDLPQKIKNVNDKNIEEVNHHTYFKDNMKKYIGFNDHILNHLKNKRLAEIHKSRKSLNEEYVKNKLLIEEHNEKMKMYNRWMYVLLVIVITMIITCIIYVFNLMRKYSIK